MSVKGAPRRWFPMAKPRGNKDRKEEAKNLRRTGRTAMLKAELDADEEEGPLG
jgi:hypothetical protein